MSSFISLFEPEKPEVSLSPKKGQRPPTEASTRPPSEAFTPSELYSRETTDSPVLCRYPAAEKIDVTFGWTKGGLIGHGAYGCVFKAMEKRTGRIFAVKQAVVDLSCEEDRKYRDKLQNELNICKDLRHPNIVACLGFESTSSELNIYLEYVAGGSMSSLLTEFGALDGYMLRQATLGVLDGLNYLHTRSPPVVHRDIKGANILVGLDFCVKLADFGCSKRSDLTKSFTTTGSIPWMAPEVILQEDGHGRKADIWSFGCAMIEMASAEKPWGNGKFENAMFALRHISMSDATPPIPEALDELGQDLARLCTQRDPEKRPSAAELLEHPFLLGCLS